MYKNNTLSWEFVSKNKAVFYNQCNFFALLLTHENIHTFDFFLIVDKCFPFKMSARRMKSTQFLYYIFTWASTHLQDVTAGAHHVFVLLGNTELLRHIFLIDFHLVIGLLARAFDVGVVVQ